MFILGIVVLAIYSFNNTEYRFGTTLENKETPWKDLHVVRTIVLFTANFSPLASILNIGFYLHTCAVPILRNAKNPEDNSKNLFIGYTIVFISYVTIGSLGYYGMMGTLFNNYFIREMLTEHSG